jgi:diguanylate cyclase (GGDEF)-like protein
MTGMKIGVLSASYTEELMVGLCEENQIDGQIVRYETFEEMYQDLDEEKIDALVTTEGYLSHDWVLLKELGEEPYYFGVAKGREDILEALDGAMNAIKTANPYYNDDLRTKYITRNSIVRRVFSDEEEEWLEENAQLRIGYLSGYMPYCGQDEDGKASGMLTDLLENICEIYGLEKQLQPYDSYENMKTALDEGKVDAIFPVYGDYGVSELQNIMFSDEVTMTTMTLFHTGDLEDDTYRIAVSHEDPFQEACAQINYPESEIFTCENIEECLDKVVSGEADVTVVETARASELTENKNWQKQLKKLQLQDRVSICFGIGRNNRELLSILNKGIMATDDSLITNSLVYYAQKSGKYTVVNFLQDHVVEVLLLLIFIFGVITVLIIIYSRSRIENQKRLMDAERNQKKERWKAEHDALTGLLNRRAYDDVCMELRHTDTPFALLMLDVDEFKHINDTYGHAVGDIALVRVGKVLKSCFRTDDYVFRYAGDEFAVLMSNITPDGTEVILGKIGRMNRTLEVPDTDEGIPSCTVSVGVAFSSKGYTEELFRQADHAMYQAKRRGRCGAAIYEPEESESSN